MSVLLQCSWIMNSAENRCAFVRAQFVQILFLLSQWTSSYQLLESDSEEEQCSDQEVNGVSVDNSVQVASDTVEHFNNSSLRSLDETVNSEMRLLLESDDVQKRSETDVRISRFIDGLR